MIFLKPAPAIAIARASFERPYGLAWLLQLVSELREWDDPQAREMAVNLRPLEQAALERLNDWLPKLSHPVRIGEHDQTAFALGLMGDYARATGNGNLADLVKSKARQFYLGDKNCPLAYEPSGEDFLSPCLGEADLMRRVLPSGEFARWLRAFLPQISSSKNGSWLQPVVSPDPSDPKLAHLDGLNLSRAWMLEGIAAGLPKGDKRLPLILSIAEEHSRAGITFLDRLSVDELDASDVEAARRLVEDEQAEIAVELARDHDLLLVAA